MVVDSGNVGHGVILAAQYNKGKTTLHGSLLQSAGPLLVVNDLKQRGGTGCTVNVHYRNAVVSDTISHDDYTENVYSEGTTGHATLNIPANTRANSEYHLTGITACEITSLSVEENLNTEEDLQQEIKVYCLGDLGGKFLGAMNNELIRDMVNAVRRGGIIIPYICERCNGVGTIALGNTTITCPDCDGYKYKGKHAANYKIKQNHLNEVEDGDINHLNDMLEGNGIKDNEGDIESALWRLWAKKWRDIPTKSNIKKYMSHFFKVKKSDIDVNEYFAHVDPTDSDRIETYCDVRIPKNLVGDMIYSGLAEKVLRYMEPGGTRLRLVYYTQVGSYSGMVDFPSTQPDYDLYLIGHEWGERYHSLPSGSWDSFTGVCNGRYVRRTGVSYNYKGLSTGTNPAGNWIDTAVSGSSDYRGNQYVRNGKIVSGAVNIAGISGWYADYRVSGLYTKYKETKNVKISGLAIRDILYDDIFIHRQVSGNSL